jgi:hypothetical protein
MRVDLDVPYTDKDEAKRLGAKWDIARKRWYVVDVENLEAFLKWIPAHQKKPVK